MKAVHLDQTSLPPLQVNLTDDDFLQIAKLAKTKFGLDLQTSKKSLVQSRLTKRLQTLNISSFSDYCRRLSRSDDVEEMNHLLSALTTNVTHFFREPHHFQTIADQLLPDWEAKLRNGGSVRIWSAACSSGEEPYSVAGCLLAANSKLSDLDIKVLATDIDQKVIARAKIARYSSNLLSQIPVQIRPMLTQTSLIDGAFEITPKAKDLIHFAQLNLMDEWPMRRKFDLIICRNAAIYFDKETQSRLWQRFSETLTDGGVLIIGHSERLSGPATQRFTSIGITTYQKKTLNGQDISKQGSNE